MRRDLLKQEDADLEKILTLAKIFEAVDEQEKTFNERGKAQSTVDVCKVDFRGQRSYNTKFRNERDANFECSRCGFKGHKASDEKCPAKGKSCNKCGGRDHFMRKCKSKKRLHENTDKPKNENEKGDKAEIIEENEKRPKIEEVNK